MEVMSSVNIYLQYDELKRINNWLAMDKNNNITIMGRQSYDTFNSNSEVIRLKTIRKMFKHYSEASNLENQNYVWLLYVRPVQNVNILPSMNHWLQV